MNIYEFVTFQADVSIDWMDRGGCGGDDNGGGGVVGSEPVTQSNVRTSTRPQICTHKTRARIDYASGRMGAKKNEWEKHT